MVPFITKNQRKCMKPDEKLFMKAIAICFKEWLKPEEAMVYLNVEKSALARRCKEYGIFTNKNGYYSKKDLDLIASGGPTIYETEAEKLKKSAKFSTNGTVTH